MPAISNKAANKNPANSLFKRNSSMRLSRIFGLPTLTQHKGARPTIEKQAVKEPSNSWIISEILATSQPLTHSTPRYFDKLLCANPKYVMNCRKHDKKYKKNHHYSCKTRGKPLARKPLAEIGGKPMIQLVWERAIEADMAPVYVATDDRAIADVITSVGGKAVMTKPDHPSGSDRV